jgi:hypothetical protein
LPARDRRTTARDDDARGRLERRDDARGRLERRDDATPTGRRGADRVDGKSVTRRSPTARHD